MLLCLLSMLKPINLGIRVLTTTTAMVTCAFVARLDEPVITVIISFSISVPMPLVLPY